MNEGEIKKPARSGMPSTKGLFGYQMKFNLSKGFPLLTTKKMNFNLIVTELLWFLRGDTNIKYLVDHGCNIWNDDAYRFFKEIFHNMPDVINISKEEFIDNVKQQKKQFGQYVYGDLGNVYGKQWRDWNGVDQLKNLIDGIIKNPEGRRHIISAWNPTEIDSMALPPCHLLMQFNCRKIGDRERERIYEKAMNGKVSMMVGHYIYPKDYTPQYEDDVPDPIGWELSESDHVHLDKCGIPRYYLDCQMYQRSADTFLGVPFNIASYALLTHIIAELTGMQPGNFIHTFGDVHVYENHFNAVNEQLERDPNHYKLPKLVINTEFWNPENILFDHVTELNSFGLTKFIENWVADDFQVSGYESYPAIKGELSVGN